MDRVSITQQHLRKKLNSYSKETIINAIFARLDFTTIDLLCNNCFLQESARKAEQEEKQEMENLMRFESAVREYNSLCKKLNEKGVNGMSFKELNRMKELLKIIKKG